MAPGLIGHHVVLHVVLVPCLACATVTVAKLAMVSVSLVMLPLTRLHNVKWEIVVISTGQAGLVVAEIPEIKMSD